MQLRFIAIGALLVLPVTACKKAADPSNACFPDAATVRQLSDKPATIELAGEQFYIVEQGTIDTRLKPCNLPDDYRVASLQVQVSGDVKATPQTGTNPCCIEDFVITEITR